MPEDAAAVEHLHRLEVIRERAWMLLAAAERGQSDHFQLSPEAVNTVATALAQMIGDRASRAAATSGFEAAAPTAGAAATGGHPTLANLWQALRRHQPAALEALGRAVSGGDALARAKSGADLAVLHRVLEPVGLAPEPEALAALVHGFAAGAFTASSPGAAVLDAPGLRRALAGDGTLPLPEALAALLADGVRRQRLAELAARLEQATTLFGVEGRFGQVLDRLLAGNGGNLPGSGPAAALLTTQRIVDTLGAVVDPIVASTVRIGGRQAGDVWRHPLAWAEDRSRELVPFHALLLALVLDLVEPLQEAGAELTDLDQLPVPAGRDLAGQILRLGLVRARHAAVARLRHPPGSDIVVELRALSIALADRLADRLRAELGRTAHDLPVARILGPLATLAAGWRERPGPGIAITATSF